MVSMLNQLQYEDELIIELASNSHADEDEDGRTIIGIVRIHIKARSANEDVYTVLQSQH